MKELWAELKALLADVSPDVTESLSKGAGAKSISSAQKELGFDLPNDLRDSLRVHDGQATDEILFHGEWYLLSIEKTVSDREYVGPSLTPFAANGAGDFLCVLNSEKEGALWPVVQFSHEGDREETVYSSYRKWFESVIDDLQRQVSLESAGGGVDGASPSMNDLVQCIGMSIDDAKPQTQIMANGTELKVVSGTDIVLKNFNEGFAVQVRNKGRIEVIHLYCMAEGDYLAFTESLTNDILPTDDCKQVRQKCGAPTRSGPDVKGKSGYASWDRFDNEEVCIHFSYREDEPGIKMITLMATDVAP